MDKKLNNKYINNLSLLSIINKDRDIKQGSYAIYPGPRCPLALVTNVFSNIKGALTLIVGTAECTYYNKNISLMFKDGYEENTTWSYSIEPKELIFGCRDGVIQALCEMSKTDAEVIFLVSACVPEMVGEDFEGIAGYVNTMIKSRIINIPAAHFKSYSSVPTKIASLTALYDLMEKPNTYNNILKKGTINLLGEDANLLKKSELMLILQNHGISINCSVPSNLTIDILRIAPLATLSIVTDLAALPLAKKMFASFGTPYVLFPHLLDPKEIRNTYYEIAGYLNISIGEEIENLYEKSQKQVELCTAIVKGKSFISGYLSLDPFIFSSFFSSLQMRPLYIEAEYYFNEDKSWKDKILAFGYNPYIGRTFNFNTTSEVLNSTTAEYYFGYNIAEKPKDNSIQFIKYETALSELGFEQPLSLLKHLTF
ncbi:nitrogenase component 1 [Clostridium estertheticum]|uniref:nitrogenase component 1 n=1 Tax=Clostridium estertheticum TaxID=238834 RepID=UPI001C7D016C|nr:nitrogenase component 1 [Clostridium estertheticum]MBX4261375.1 nitrogenase component 1 [Clostridium estertheticum]WLC70655.1 nitrogenase component 1 [Clostridium estertheticum]